MTPYRLGYWLKTVVADIVSVDGLLFVNYRDLSHEALVSEVSTHPSPKDAQMWMNIVLLDDFISEACGDDWNDGDAGEVLDAVAKAWGFQVRAKYPSSTFTIEKISDSRSGDLGLRLIGSLG
ncbi:hypothetical protein CH75_17290 [Dyella jiangningensis]|nr:hypothetical protein CH75_17290 [Dyella jiangningensis]